MWTSMIQTCTSFLRNGQFGKFEISCKASEKEPSQRILILVDYYLTWELAKHWHNAIPDNIYTSQSVSQIE